MKSGATESSYQFLSHHYKFPEDVEVSHFPQELIKSKKKYKILWAHHAYDQPVFLNFECFIFLIFIFSYYDIVNFP